MYSIPLWKRPPKTYKRLSQIMAFLEVNEKGQYILPFSRRVVFTPDLSWLPQSQQPFSSAHNDLSLVNHTSHHIQQVEEQNLPDDDETDAEVAAYFDQHLYDITEEDMDDDDDDEETDDDEQYESTDVEDDAVDYEVNSSSESYISSSHYTISPWPCGDPFSDYDLEC